MQIRDEDNKTELHKNQIFLNNASKSSTNKNYLYFIVAIIVQINLFIIFLLVCFYKDKIFKSKNNKTDQIEMSTFSTPKDSIYQSTVITENGAKKHKIDNILQKYRYQKKN